MVWRRQFRHDGCAGQGRKQEKYAAIWRSQHGALQERRSDLISRRSALAFGGAHRLWRGQALLVPAPRLSRPEWRLAAVARRRRPALAAGGQHCVPSPLETVSALRCWWLPLRGVRVVLECLARLQRVALRLPAGKVFLCHVRTLVLSEAPFRISIVALIL